MQYDQQEIRYGSDPQSNASTGVGYLNKMRICENQHIFTIGSDHEELMGRSVTPRSIPDQRYLLLAAL
jgi:hypothetical protein